MDANRVIAISGERGCGKTTLCTRVAGLARAQGLVLGGVLTQARFVDGHKVSLLVEDLRTGERCRLAERQAGTDGPSTGGWNFHAAGLGFGVQALERAAPCDLLIVDELGPLELERGEGWAVGLDVLAAGRYRLGLVVVRPALVAELQQQLGLELVVVTAVAADCDALAARILSELDGAA